MFRAFVTLLLLLCWGCDRTEELPSPVQVQGTKSANHVEHSTSATGRASPERAARARCVVSTPEQPPPTAEKAATCPKDPEHAPPLPRGRVQFLDAPGQPAVNVELAQTDPHRMRGLMYRTHMPGDQGMLFSWSGERVRSFWMRNTCIPLDMLFIAGDGLIVGILEQVPTLNEESRQIPCPAQHVLEVNAGWCREHGVRAGQRVGIEPPFASP